MCAFRRRTRSGELRCAMYDNLIIEATCEACEFGPGTRKHVGDHPRAKRRKLPKQPGEAAWLESLGIQPRIHHA